MTEQGANGLEQLPQVGVGGPGPSALADLYSLQGDVAFAKQCAEAYVAWSDDGSTGDGDAPVRQALWNACVISYRRAFNSGRAHLAPKGSRFRLDDALNGVLTGAQRKTHEDVRDMANQHVAHRVGELEGAIATVFLAPPPQERAILGIGSMSARFVGPTAEFADEVVDLCRTLLEVLGQLIDQRSGQLLANLQATASLDDLYARSVLPGSDNG